MGGHALTSQVLPSLHDSGLWEEGGRESNNNSIGHNCIKRLSSQGHCSV